MGGPGPEGNSVGSVALRDRLLGSAIGRRVLTRGGRERVTKGEEVEPGRPVKDSAKHYRSLTFRQTIDRVGNEYVRNDSQESKRESKDRPKAQRRG